MEKPQKINWDKNLKFKICFQKKQWKFSRFPSFRFCPIAKIKNLEILENVLLLEILTVVVTEDAKTTKN